MKPDTSFNICKHRVYAKRSCGEILNYFYDDNGELKQDHVDEYSEWFQKTYGKPSRFKEKEAINV